MWWHPTIRFFWSENIFVTISARPYARSTERNHFKDQGVLLVSNLLPPMLYNGSIINGLGMGLLPDMYNCRLRMCRECRERFPSHLFQKENDS